MCSTLPTLKREVVVVKTDEEPHSDLNDDDDDGNDDSPCLLDGWLSGAVVLEWGALNLPQTVWFQAYCCSFWKKEKNKVAKIKWKRGQPEVRKIEELKRASCWLVGHIFY